MSACRDCKWAVLGLGPEQAGECVCPLPACLHKKSSDRYKKPLHRYKIWPEYGKACPMFNPRSGEAVVVVPSVPQTPHPDTLRLDWLLKHLGDFIGTREAIDRYRALAKD